jgi:DNA repair protein RecO
MSEYTTYAIVLKKETINEYDGKIILYTELMGKTEIIAKGLKKILAKFNSHLELLNLVEITFIAVNNKHLTSVLTLNNFSNIRHNPLALKNALKMLNFFNEAIIESEKDDFLWRALVGYLKNLNLINKITPQNQELFIDLINTDFLIKLIQSLGLMPDFADLNNHFNNQTIKIIKFLSQFSISDILKSKELSNFKKIDYNIIEEDLKKKIII